MRMTSPCSRRSGWPSAATRTVCGSSKRAAPWTQTSTLWRSRFSVDHLAQRAHDLLLAVHEVLDREVGLAPDSRRRRGRAGAEAGEVERRLAQRLRGHGAGVDAGAAGVRARARPARRACRSTRPARRPSRRRARSRSRSGRSDPCVSPTRYDGEGVRCKEFSAGRRPAAAPRAAPAVGPSRRRRGPGRWPAWRTPTASRPRATTGGISQMLSVVSAKPAHVCVVSAVPT